MNWTRKNDHYARGAAYANANWINWCAIDRSLSSSTLIPNTQCVGYIDARICACAYTVYMRVCVHTHTNRGGARSSRLLLHCCRCCCCCYAAVWSSCVRSIIWTVRTVWSPNNPTAHLSGGCALDLFSRIMPDGIPIRVSKKFARDKNVNGVILIRHIFYNNKST